MSRSELAQLLGDGWDGSTVQFQLGTQAGNPGSAGEGTPDETDVIVVLLAN